MQLSDQLMPVVGGQTQLPLAECMYTAPAAALGLLGLDSNGTVSGLVIDLGEDQPVIVLKSAHRIRHEPGVAPALTAYGDSVPVDVWIDGEPCGRAMIMDLVEAMLVKGRVGQAECGRWFSDALRAVMVARRCPGSESTYRRAVVSVLAGPALPLMEVLAGQRIFSLVRSRRVVWHEVVRSFDDLAQAGMAALAAFALRPQLRFPGRSLARRLVCIGDPGVIGDFVRVAISIDSSRERGLFEQALQRSLKSLFACWREVKAPAVARGLVTACREAIGLAHRAAFCAARETPHKGFDTTSVLYEFRLGAALRSINRHRFQSSRRLGDVRPAVLQAWASRAERELSSRPRSQSDLADLWAEGNEVLEAAALGVWTCNELQTSAWATLVDVDWSESDSVDIPDRSWICSLPAGSADKLSAVGIRVEAVCTTARLQQEADEMENCLVGSLHYLDELTSGRSRIYALTGSLRLTLEVRRDDAGRWALSQARGVRNQPFENNCLESDDVRWASVREFILAVCENDEQA